VRVSKRSKGKRLEGKGARGQEIRKEEGGGRRERGGGEDEEENEMKSIEA
jgi:hypothetical protein